MSNPKPKCNPEKGRETKIAPRLEAAFHKALSGMKRHLLRQSLMFTFRNREDELEEVLDGIIEKAEKHRNLRDKVLSMPWNKYTDTLNKNNEEN